MRKCINYLLLQKSRPAVSRFRKGVWAKSVEQHGVHDIDDFTIIHLCHQLSSKIYEFKTWFYFLPVTYHPFTYYLISISSNFIWCENMEEFLLKFSEFYAQASLKVFIYKAWALNGQHLVSIL